MTVHCDVSNDNVDFKPLSSSLVTAALKMNACGDVKMPVAAEKTQFPQVLKSRVGGHGSSRHMVGGESASPVNFP